jgi:hypothetical protein
MFTAAQSAVNTPRLIALIINLFNKLLVLEYKKPFSQVLDFTPDNHLRLNLTLMFAQAPQKRCCNNQITSERRCCF